MILFGILGFLLPILRNVESGRQKIDAALEASAENIE
jgi:hypothetical protein